MAPRVGGRLGDLALRRDVFVPLGAVRAESASQRAAGIGDHHRAALVLHGEDVGQRPRRVAGRRDNLHGRVAEGELHALGADDHVARRHAACRGRRPPQRRLPIGRTHDDLGAEALLQFRGALIVVAVRVADDHVLEVARIETERGEALNDFRLGGPGKVRVEEDDARAGLQRPRRVLARAEPIEVVEHLQWRRVPRGAVGRCRRPASPTAAGGLTAGGRRGRGPASGRGRRADRTQIDERIAEIETRGRPRRGDVCVDLGLRVPGPSRRRSAARRRASPRTVAPVSCESSCQASTATSIYFQQLPALRAGAAGAVGGAPRAGRPITGSSSGLAPRPRPPRPGGVHPSHAGPFWSMRVSALTV